MRVVSPGPSAGARSGSRLLFVSAANEEKLPVAATPSISSVWGKALEHFSCKDAPRRMARELLPHRSCPSSTVGSRQCFGIWVSEVGAVAPCRGVFRRPIWEAVMPGKVPQTVLLPFFISGVLQHDTDCIAGSGIKYSFVN